MEATDLVIFLESRSQKSHLTEVRAIGHINIVGAGGGGHPMTHGEKGISDITV